MVLSLPLPYISAVLQALLAALLMQRRGDVRTIGFVALSACMALLVGLRWSFPNPYLWFAVALVSSMQAPLAWLCFDRSDGVGLGAVLPWALLWGGPVYWNGVELLLVALYVGYGGALLGLGWSQHARFDALRLSQVPDLRRAAIWAGWALLFNGVLEGLIGLDYWLYAGRHAPALVGVAHGVLLPLLLYGVWCAGRVFVPGDAPAAACPTTARLPLAPAPIAAPAIGVVAVHPMGQRGNIVDSAADAALPVVSADAVQQEAAHQNTADGDAATVARLTELVQAQELFRDPDLSVLKLARRMGVPARELSAAVNRQCGQNVAQWVNGFRIAAACQQLVAGDAPITNVMLDCGFFTKSNFNREFRRHTGLSPSTYRQQRRDQVCAATVAVEGSGPSASAASAVSPPA